mmetsp:Transcript_30864/g.65305  ORF Transcript_30864/g.65305 Transcript_30864/m.65305 type:complete len:216 (+) Transcript_30864:1809-2456(+)
MLLLKLCHCGIGLVGIVFLFVIGQCLVGSAQFTINFLCRRGRIVLLHFGTYILAIENVGIGRSLRPILLLLLMFLPLLILRPYIIRILHLKPLHSHLRFVHKPLFFFGTQFLSPHLSDFFGKVGGFHGGIFGNKFGTDGVGVVDVGIGWWFDDVIVGGVGSCCVCFVGIAITWFLGGCGCTCSCGCVGWGGCSSSRRRSGGSKSRKSLSSSFVRR